MQRCFVNIQDVKFSLMFFFLGSDSLISYWQIKKQILSAKSTVKDYFLGSKTESKEKQLEKLDSNKDHP